MEEALENFPLEDRKTLLPLLRRLGRVAETGEDQKRSFISNGEAGTRFKTGRQEEQ
jgi:hypothetical protein